MKRPPTSVCACIIDWSLSAKKSVGEYLTHVFKIFPFSGTDCGKLPCISVYARFFQQ